MSFLYDNVSADFTSPQNNVNIECSKCLNEPKLIRCTCCNEIITINDFVKFIKNQYNEIIKLVKMADKTCVKISVKNIYKLTKYFKQQDIFTSAINFNYKINYNEVKLSPDNTIKQIRNVEFVELLSNFTQNNIDIKYLIVCPNISQQAEVLIDINNLNIQI